MDFTRQDTFLPGHIVTRALNLHTNICTIRNSEYSVQNDGASIALRSYRFIQNVFFFLSSFNMQQLFCAKLVQNNAKTF